MPVTHLTNQSQFIQSNAVFNGTNITGTIASNGISLSVANPGAGGGVAISGDANSQSTGTVNFSNSNGVTFGLSNNGVMTASVQTNYQAPGAYLTTAMASNRGSDFVQANAVFNGTNASGTIASNGISVSVANPAAGVGIAAGTRTATTANNLLFDNANGVTFGLNAVGGSVMTASVATNYQSQGAYLTTAMLSNAVTLSNINISAGTTSGNASAFTFNNANGVSFGYNNGTLTASVAAAGGAQTGISGIQISNNTYTSGTVTWQNANGISFGSSGANGISASYTVPSTAGLISAINVSAGTTSGNLSALTFSNSNGLTFGLNAGTVTGSHNGLTTAALSNHSHNLATTTTNGSLIVVATTNSNGATFAVPPYLTTAQAPGAYLTTARASNDAVGLNTALTGNGVLWTVNSSGISLNVPAFLTTAMQSGSQSQLWIMGNSSGTIGGTNISGTVFSNGMSLSVVAPGGGAAVTASASNGSFTVGTLGFSNANNVTFGTSAGGIITASVAAPGAAAENNWFNLLGANTAGNTTASGSTIGVSGINLTLSGTNGSIFNISAPAVSSLSAVNGFFVSANASTISLGQNQLQFFEPQPLMSTNTSTFLPGIGSWYIQPIHVPNPLASGRLNFLVSHGSTSAMLNLSNGSSFASGTTGGRSLSFNHSYMAALYTRGAGANSTRWDSIWSNTWGFSVSQSVGVSTTNASQLTLSHQHTAQYVGQVGTDGAYTLSGIGQSHSASFANSSTATSAAITGMSSLQNMISGAMLIPIGFNTSLSPGNYLLGLAYSTASTTAGTSINGASIWPVINWYGFNKISSYSHRQFASTASSTGSQYFLPQGVFSAASASAPATINPRDVRSLSNNVFPYVNFMQSNFN